MKRSLIVIASLLVLAGCSSTTKLANGDPIANQKLSTSFKSEGIKIETDCTWMNSWFKTQCDVVAIEAVGTAATNGNTESNRRTALIRAGDRARASVRHFIQEDIQSSRVTTTIAKNVEKASDRAKTKLNVGEEVEMSDTDAATDTNYSIRANSNDTAYQLTETIRANARGILRGFRTVKEEVVGAQTVAVTIRWDANNDTAANTLRRKFGN